jgi:hypothetical protein
MRESIRIINYCYYEICNLKLSFILLKLYARFASYRSDQSPPMLKYFLSMMQYYKTGFLFLSKLVGAILSNEGQNRSETTFWELRNYTLQAGGCAVEGCGAHPQFFD